MKFGNPWRAAFLIVGEKCCFTDFYEMRRLAAARAGSGVAAVGSDHSIERHGRGSVCSEGWRGGWVGVFVFKNVN